MDHSSKIRVGIIGATGYTAIELVRLLLRHPSCEIKAVTSRQNEGMLLGDLFPAFYQQTSLCLELLNITHLAKKTDVVFLCLPHHESMETAAQCLNQGLSVIDLSADFRLKDPQIYEKWYGPHTQQSLLSKAVYGLPELNRDQIKKAQLVASPGCYPTSILLGLAPLVKNQKIHLKEIICDSKSGVSGAGRTAKVDNLFCEVHEGFKPYQLTKHRHTPEIEQGLSNLAGQDVSVLFSPHLLPIDRGILSTIYCKPKLAITDTELEAIYQNFYQDEPFIKIMPLGKYPSTQQVRGTNECHLGLAYDSKTNQIIIISAIDNLTKGASGQAIQSMNLMFDLTETTGLHYFPVFP